ncbi:MAG: hypothetical protein ACYCT2_04510 [Thermoplasmataceae archaeon]
MAKKSKGSRAVNTAKTSGKTKRNIPTHVGKWRIGELVIGLLATLLLFVGLLAKPTYTILNHVIVFNDGIIAPAIIFGAVIWAVIETFTPPGKSILDLIWRAFAGFVIGGFIGGFMGYEFSFAQYIIVPAYAGNSAAILYLVSILVFGLVVIWDAVWSDRKGYMGQKGKNVKTLNFKESGSGKAARKMIALVIALVSVFLMIFLSAGIGHALVAGSDNSPVLQSEAITSYVYGSSGAIPFGQVNGTATFDFPSSTVNNVTTYSNEVWIRTNLTVAELNNFGVSRIVITSTDSHPANVSLGTGFNVSNFQPFVYQSLDNLTSASFSLSPSYLTGNQSENIMVLVQSNVTSISISFHAYGNTGLTTIIGSYSAEQTGYLIGTIFTFVAAILVAPWYDLGIFDRRNPAKGGK